jgi:hypothetical protein
MLDAVDKIMKRPTTDPEGVQRELQNQGYGDINLQDVEAVMKNVQGRPAKIPEKPPEPPAKPAESVADIAGSAAKRVENVVPTEMTTAIEQHNDGVIIKTDKPAKRAAPPIRRIDELVMNRVQLKEPMDTIKRETGESYATFCRDRYHLFRTNPQLFIDTSATHAKLPAEGDKTAAKVPANPPAGSFTLNWGPVAEAVNAAAKVAGFAEASAALAAFAGGPAALEAVECISASIPCELCGQKARFQELLH